MGRRRAAKTSRPRWWQREAVQAWLIAAILAVTALSLGALRQLVAS